VDHRDAAYWKDAYDTAETPWQLPAVSPPLARLLDEEPDRLRPGRVAVLGCGRSHEPAELARRGFQAVGIDFVSLAIAPLAGGKVRYVSGDVRRLPLVSGSLDYVMEQTCFCAIDPGDRPLYVREVARALRPGGRVFGLFYEPSPPGNPPFAVTEDEIRSAFAGRFEVERLERAKDSIERRAGREWLAILRKIS
jgi:SAM-dependent methyltransferase